MADDSERVIVSAGTVAAGGAQVHHRDFPEIRAEGADPADAALQLVNQLTRALDSALTNWRRDAIQQAIDEVREFAASKTP